MRKEFFEYCLSLYDKEYQRCSQNLMTRRGTAALSSKIREDIDKEAQKSAIRVTIISCLRAFPNVAVSDLWADIYRAHLFRKSGIENADLIRKVISADQSWKKSSGHAFEEMVKELANQALSSTDIDVVLQRDLNALIKDGKIDNEPRDISWLKEQIRSDIFDLYCILKVGDKKYCFGCVQAKTSIRDRVTRDREPSIHAMKSYFWSSAIVLDGEFLKLPKFQGMINGGTTEFPANGWHGMYVFSKDVIDKRIYPLEVSFETFASHAMQASKQWKEQRQWMTESWIAE